MCLETLSDLGRSELRESDNGFGWANRKGLESGFIPGEYIHLILVLLCHLAKKVE